MTIRAFDIPPLKDRCGFVRVMWVGGAWWNHWSAGECRYYGWRWSVGLGPVIVFIWPVGIGES